MSIRSAVVSVTFPAASRVVTVLTDSRCFHAIAASGARRSELMPGLCVSRSFQNSLPR